MSWNLLLQVFFVLFPCYLYSLYLFSRCSVKRCASARYLLGIFCGLSGVLSMQQPAFFAGGTAAWDAHGVLLFLAFALGGLMAGGAALAVLALYLAAGAGWESSLYEGIFLVLLLIPCFLMAGRIYRQSLRKSLLQVFLVCVYMTVLHSALMLCRMPEGGLTDGAPAIPGLVLGASFLPVMLVLWQTVHVTQYNRYQQNLQNAEKLHLISELAASVAHEVRNPLQVTRGFLQLSLKLGDSRQQHYLATAIEELDRAEEIITAFLDFAKPKVERMDRLDAGMLLSEVSQMMESYSHLNGTKLHYAYTSGMYIVGDPAKLKQVLINLLKNAIEASKEDGEIFLSVQAGKGEIQFRIRDNGEGMSQEQLDRLGLPFYTTKHRGTGLGVMVTKRIVEAMRGRIVYSSRIGFGTDVLVAFPEQT